jgi:hypothetical protein
MGPRAGMDEAGRDSCVAAAERLKSPSRPPCSVSGVLREVPKADLSPSVTIHTRLTPVTTRGHPHIHLRLTSPRHPVGRVPPQRGA